MDGALVAAPKPAPVAAACGSADEGFRGTVACSAAGITYRQLDYWARTGLVTPSIRSAAGSGSTRLYSFRDILALQVVKRLLDSGVSLANIRTAIATVGQLQDCQLGSPDLSELTLISDGSGVYLCTSASEVIDLLRGGQAVFGIAVGQVWNDVQATLAPLPRERADTQVADVPRPRLRIVS
jgi:DNA-binding transcriptional MerR regulator